MEDVGGLLEKLDVKDKSILRELFKNARASFSQIGKNIRLSKEGVNYRIKRMKRIGLLTGFNTVIDITKLGWKIFFVFIRFRQIDFEKESEIFESLDEHPNVSWLVKCLGNYDCVVKFFSRDYIELNDIMKEIESKFKGNFDEYDVVVATKEYAVPFSFMYGPRGEDIEYLKTGKKKQVNLADIDLKILKAIANNARTPTTEIAKKLKVPRDVVNYHLKKLEKNKVIITYRPDIWPNKLGYGGYFLMLKLEKLDEPLKEEVKSFILNHPNVTYFYNTIGSNDMQIEFRLKVGTRLNEVLMEFRSILKPILKNHEFQIILHEYKYTYFPECLMETDL